MKTETAENFLYTPPKKLNDALDIYFCFPGPYYVGMSSLGFLSLFHSLDKETFIKPHRIFTDSPKPNINPEGLVGFSFSFELDFIQIFKLLEQMKIPILKEERSSDMPLVFAGGPVVSTNPEPFADFFDFIVLGDGEELIVDLAKTYNAHKNSSRQSKLKEIARLNGIYVPEFFDVSYNIDYTIEQITTNKDFIDSYIHKYTQESLNKCLYSPILTTNTVFSDTLLVELVRGCSQKCFFCLASFLNIPVRWPNKEQIYNALNTGLQYTNKVGLMGALITEHPDFEEILSYIYNKHLNNPIKITTSSLRADKITPHIAKILSACNQKQITISLEAGSENLRNSINKNLKNNDVLNCVDICQQNNINSIKIYSMIGLPNETDTDIQELINFIKEIKAKFTNVEVILSVNSFIPKAHTPFERVTMISPTNYQEKMRYIKTELFKTCKVRVSSPKWDLIQAIIARGDRKLGQILYLFYKYGATLGSFNRAFKDFRGVYPEQNWHTNRLRAPSEVLPWNHIRF